MTLAGSMKGSLSFCLCRSTHLGSAQESLRVRDALTLPNVHTVTLCLMVDPYIELITNLCVLQLSFTRTFLLAHTHFPGGAHRVARPGPAVPLLRGLRQGHDPRLSQDCNTISADSRLVALNLVVASKSNRNAMVPAYAMMYLP